MWSIQQQSGDPRLFKGGADFGIPSAAELQFWKQIETDIRPNDTFQLVQSEFGLFLINPVDGVNRHIADGKFWDSFLLYYYDKYLTPESVFLDIGAFIGSHTVYCAKKCHHVYCFEPQRTIFFQLCANLYLNYCQNVHPFNVGLYDKEVKMCALDVDYSTFQFSASLAFNEKTLSKNMAIFKTLDSFNFQKVDFIKIDAECCDYNVLVGGIETIKKFRPYICFEKNEGTITKYVEFFDKINYKIKLIVGDVDYFAAPAERADF